MKIIKTPIPDLVVIEPSVFNDQRGYFFESYNQERYFNNDMNMLFVQDNESKSGKNVLSGLHFQKPPFAQGKLVRVKQGKVLDDAAIDKIIKAKNFQSSLATVRQVEFALFDFKVYQKLYKTENEIQDLLNTIRNQFAVMIPPSYNKFQNGFSHIFSGGYAAGYYSYKWAEVLSADAFYMFIDSQNVFNKELGIKYKNTILSQGGSQDMDKLFYNFAQREPSVDSLLKIDGIIS